VALAGCSTNNGSPLSPSAVAENANSGGPPPPRSYKAGILPTSVGAGSTANAFSFTITNCDTAQCDAAHATPPNQNIRSITIQVQTGFTNVSALSAPSTWNAILDAGVIKLDVKSGNDGIVPGGSLSVTFTADAPCSVGTNDRWTTAAYQDDNFVTTTPYLRFGSDPQVTVTGSCQVPVCPQGYGYWKEQYPNAWPQTVLDNGLTLGTVHYTAQQLEDILNANPSQPGGPANGLLILAHQLIAARLNIAKGVDGSSISADLTAADQLIGNLVIPPVGSASLAPDAGEGTKNNLEAFNEGGCGTPSN
jgi:hypothetical protein